MQGTAVEKLSLLYVDDEAMLHEPFKLYMEMMFNFQVDTASSGDEALLKLLTSSHE